MNRWVLLEHKVNSENIVDVHYDFLMENRFNCLTWKVDQIPSINRCSVKIQKQPDHRLVWLSRSKYVLSGNRGLVTRVDNGTFLNISPTKLPNESYIFNSIFWFNFLRLR